MNRLSNQRVVLLAALGLIGVFFDSREVVAQKPASGSAPVTIVSPLPVPVTGQVRDVGNGTPFTTTTLKTSSIGEPPEVVFPTEVVSGHLVVVEQVSVRLSNCAGGTLNIEDFGLHAGTKAVFLEPVHVSSTLANTYLANELTKFVVEPGETIRLEAENFGSSGCSPSDLSLVATISGVVIPFP
jgi:hypothetical protein